MHEIESGRVFYYLTQFLNEYTYLCKNPKLKDQHVFIVNNHCLRNVHDDEIERVIFSSIEKAVEKSIEDFQKKFRIVNGINGDMDEINGMPIEKFLREYYYPFIIKRDRLLANRDIQEDSELKNDLMF